MLDLHQTFRISPISSNNMIYDVNDYPGLQDSSQEPSTSSKSPNYPFSVKSCLILIKCLRISFMSSNNMIYNVKYDSILQVFSQEPSTSSKSQTHPLPVKSYLILIELLLIFNQSTIFKSHSSAELSLSSKLS